MRGEFDFIKQVSSAFGTQEGVLGIGDDCAVIPQDSSWETVVSTDMLVEGSHFLLSDVSPYQLGWKSAASNFSDIAAMGAEAVGSFLAIALPADFDSVLEKMGVTGPGAAFADADSWLDEFIRGYGDISREYGFPLLGGDTTSSVQGLCICVTVLGRCPKGRSIKRSGARPGDVICVSGNLGDSAAGLSLVLERASNASAQKSSENTAEVPFESSAEVPSKSSAVSEEENGKFEQFLIEKHYMPKPRIELGILLGKSGAVGAMMDISDGVASDLRHMLVASSCAAKVDFAQLTISAQAREFCRLRGLDPYRNALCGGEDYELLFTLHPAECELGEDGSIRLKSSGLRLPQGCRIIGKILAPNAERAVGNIEWSSVPPGYPTESLQGFKHF